MKAKIEYINPKTLIGMRQKMSLVNNKTPELFRTFMPRRKEIAARTLDKVFDLQIFPEDYFDGFSPQKPFEKWALVEVKEVSTIPEEMEVFELAGGMYAIFEHRGDHAGQEVFQYIFNQWLPKSDYLLENRPHFGIMPVGGEAGKPSVEYIHVPVRAK